MAHSGTPVRKRWRFVTDELPVRHVGVGWEGNAKFLFGVKMLATVLAVFVYSRFAPFVDSERYLNATFEFGALLQFDRTIFTDSFYALLKRCLVEDVFVHLSMSALTAGAIWYLFHGCYAFTKKRCLWLCILLPHFLIWSGVVAKEPIAIVAFLLVVKGCVEITVHGRTNLAVLFGGALIAVLMRPHYAVAYGVLLVASIARASLKSTVTGRSGLVWWILVFLGLALTVATSLWASYGMWSDLFYEIMERARDYFFLYDANSNRYYIEWESAGDFFRDIWWGVPVSIIGPTLSEATQRPAFIPVLVEGIISLWLVFYFAYCLLVLSSRVPYFRPLVCLGFLPALCLALAANHLLGVFNPGSAIRYKQSLAPLFYFYPLLLLAEVNAKDATARIRQAVSYSGNIHATR